MAVRALRQASFMAIRAARVFSTLGSISIYTRRRFGDIAAVTAETNTTTPPQAKTLIWVVDDDPMVAEIVEAILKMHRYQTVVFARPQDAWEGFLEARPRPDLLLTDFLMDEMNGLELIEKCKQVQPNLKTILYSGSVGQDIFEERGIKPNNFLSKPFQPKELLAMIETLLKE